MNTIRRLIAPAIFAGLVLFGAEAGSAAPPQREVEPNDDFAHPTTFTNEITGQSAHNYYYQGEVILRIPANGALPPSSNPSIVAIDGGDRWLPINTYDYDYYKFVTPARTPAPGTENQEVLVNLRFYCNNSATGDWQLDIYDSNYEHQAGYPINFKDCRNNVDGGYPLQVRSSSTGGDVYYVNVRGPLWTYTDSVVTINDIKFYEAKIASVGGVLSYDDYTLKIITDSSSDLSSKKTVSGQIGWLEDVDSFYVTTTQASPTASIGFYCNKSVNSPKPGDWIIQVFDTNNDIASSYTVNYTQCRTDAGANNPFLFNVGGDVTGTYTIKVKGPWYNYDASGSPILTGTLDNADYQLKLLTDITDPGTGGGNGGGTTTGAVTRTILTDLTAASADLASVTLTGCGASKQGRFTITGSKLDLGDLSASTTDGVSVSVKIGDLVCDAVSNALTKSTVGTTKAIYRYPKPKAPATGGGGGGGGGINN